MTRPSLSNSNLDAGNPFHPDFPDLLPHHVKMLREESGIADAVIRERGYRSVLGHHGLKLLNFATSQQRTPALLIPVWTPDGRNGVYQARPDNPRRDADDRPIKYEMPAGNALHLDVPPRCRPLLGDPSVPLWITEGVKKGDALASHGMCVVALPGVWGFKGRNDKGGLVWSPEWDHVALSHRDVRIVYDSDVMSKESVRAALDRLTYHLRQKGAHVRHVYLPGGDVGAKVGVDDFLVTHPVAELDRYTIEPPLPVAGPASTIASKLASGDDRHPTDLGNAKRFVSVCGDDLHFSHKRGKWLTWTGERWEWDERGDVMRRAKESIPRAVYGEAKAATDEGVRRALAEWGVRSESHGTLKAAVALAQSEPSIPILLDQLDRDPWLLNVTNGTLDLRTGEMRPHRRSDLLTKVAPVTFDPQATCPQWLDFLNRVMDGKEEMISFLQRAVGYSLTGDVTEQVLFFLHGTGANGKSTFLGAVLDLLGDYGKQAAPSLLLAKRFDSHPTEIADVAGVRFLSTIEVDEGRRMAEALVKQMTGGDRLKARGMREDFWEFPATHKIWLAANHKPVIRGTDEAIWRRIHLVPFEVVIPKTERDRQLPAKFRAERSGILNWALTGCLAWHENGLGTPADVEKATERYRVEMDTLADFLADRCILAETATVPIADLYRAYQSWCDANGEKAAHKRAFGMKMDERGFVTGHDSSGKKRIRRGIGLLSAPQEAAIDCTTDANSDVSGDLT